MSMNQEVSNLPYDTQCNIALFLGVPKCPSSAEIWFHVQVLNRHMLKCLLPDGEGPLLALLLGACPFAEFDDDCLVSYVIENATSMRDISHLKLLHQFGADLEFETAFVSDKNRDIIENIRGIVGCKRATENMFYTRGLYQNNGISGFEYLWFTVNDFYWTGSSLGKACPCTFASDDHADSAGIIGWENPMTRECDYCYSSVCKWPNYLSSYDACFINCTCCRYPYESCTCGFC